MKIEGDFYGEANLQLTRSGGSIKYSVDYGNLGFDLAGEGEYDHAPATLTITLGNQSRTVTGGYVRSVFDPYSHILASVTAPVTAGQSVQGGFLANPSDASPYTHAFNLIAFDTSASFVGTAANDYVFGSNQFDRLTGGAGNDAIDGGGGADRMSGGLGDDSFTVNSASDAVTELAGQGHDTIYTSASFKLRTGVSIEALYADAANAKTPLVLTGNEIAQAIAGNAGANRLSGGGGNDALYGHAGNDILSGGTGSDRFVFDTALNAKTNLDRVTDFGTGGRNNDSFYLDHDAFQGPVRMGQLSASAFKDLGVNGAHLDSTDRIIYNSKTGDLFFDANGSSPGHSVKFAHLDNHAHLTAADFFIF